MTTTGPTTQPEAAPPRVATGSRRRAAGGIWLLLAAVLLAVGWVAAGALARPPDQTCDVALARDVCLETIDAAFRRGMPRLHPLILAAHAEPGPAAGPAQYGHRATVTFSMLGVPGPVSVRLYFDAGAHWGGIVDPSDVELAFWTVVQGVLIVSVVGGSWLLLRRRRA